MRVLYWPQLSMRSYADSRWLVSQDSQATKMQAWMRELPDDWEWTWIVPMHDQASGWDKLNVDFIHLRWAPNVLLDRFTVDPRLRDRLKDDDFDVAFVESIEHVTALQHTLNFLGKDYMPVIGMIGLYDDRDDTFYFRQLEGFLAADEVIFPLEMVKRYWLERIAKMVTPAIRERMAGKGHVIPAIFSPREVITARPELPTEPRIPVINFISRLSDDDRTRYTDFFKAINIIDERGYDFEVWVANPNEAKPEQWIYKQSERISVASYSTKGRDEYLRRLWLSDIVPVLYPQDEGYSVGFCEAVVAENVMVTQDTWGREGTCGLRFSAKGKADAIADVLAIAIESVRKPIELKRIRKAQHEWANARTVEANVDKIKVLIEEVTQE